MAERDGRGAQPFVPEDRSSIAALAEAVQSCRGCDLYERSTQAVFGAGAVPASLMLVGEQPGDVEDRQGKPFVGPAGRILGRALTDVGVPARTTYVTNAVKHFCWHEDPRGGKRRIHERPDPWQVRACLPWLGAEIERVSPRTAAEVLSAMG